MGFRFRSLRFASSTVAALSVLVAGCGGSGSSTSVAPASTQDVLLSMNVPTDANFSSVEALPGFHVAPVLLDEPAETDAADPNASAAVEAHVQAVPSELQYLSTRRLTLQTLRDAGSGRISIQQSTNGEDIVTPMASGTVVTTYSPAQIRAAYGLPALPAATATLTVQQAAQMGAGQTIYIVDASSDPNVVAELSAFNQKFGLPTCVTTAIATTTKLPLTAAPTTGCTLSVVYSTSTGAMTSTVPVYDSGWHTEIALDVQWAHAIAPMARIIVISAPNATLNNLIGAISLANQMGPGIVSMSFGAKEGSWTSSVDSTFSAANMSYLAATGDSGTAVEWPAVSTRVLAVGGTTLTYVPGNVRSEVAWSGAGGGLSAYVAKPSYQTTSIPGMGSYATRGVSDVAMNADPATGQYVCVITPGSTTAGWISVGGTSLSTPQWAGLLAIVNAQRALAAKTIVGQPHSLLYGQVAATSATYASAFADIAAGSNGSCKTCLARAGWDSPTGLGTPNATALLATLSGTAPATAAAPVVTSTAINGTTATSLSFSVLVSAANPVAFALSGGPAGMAISSAGVVSWPTPVAGTYAVSVVATDTKTGLMGKGIATVTILPAGPVIQATAMTGVAGKPMQGTITITDATSNTISIIISGVPLGMTFSIRGSVITAAWSKPVTGSYTLRVKATDGNGRTASTSIPLTVSVR